METREDFERAERELYTKFGLTYRQRYLEGAGRGLRVVEVGDGEPVVFVHGGGGVGALWAPLLAELRGVRAIVIDRPGFGLSAGMDHTRVDLRRFAVEVLTAVLDDAKLSAAPFVANSVGGLWTFWLALDRPRRVANIVQLGCPAFLLDTDAPFAMRLLAQPVLGPLLFRMQPPSPQMTERMYRQLGEDPSSGAVGSILPLATAASLIPEYLPSWQTLLRSLLGLSGPRAGIPLGETALARIQQDTLFIWGRQDPFGKADAGRRAAALMRSASIEVIAGGHLPWLDDPVRCGALVRSHISNVRAPVAQRVS